jgi:hypothetical protein
MIAACFEASNYGPRHRAWIERYEAGERADPAAGFAG